MSMDGIIHVSNARLSFPNLAEPQCSVDAATGKERVSYNCELLLAPDHPAFAQFMKRYGELALDKWKENANVVMQMIQSDRKSRCYGVGEEKVNQKTFKPYDGYAGHLFITAGRPVKPQIIQADGTALDPNNTMAYQQMTRLMYGGCRVNAAIRPWIQDNKYGKGVRCDLIAIQFFKDDTPFGEGSVDVSGMFKPVDATQTMAPPPVTMPGAPFPGLPSFLTGN